MRLLTTGALGLAALAVAAAMRRPRRPPETQRPSARVEAEPLVTWFVRVPANTPPRDPIAICGSTAELGNWDPMGITLRRVESHLYRAAIHVPRGTVMEYKITRGHWDNVEKCRDGSERDNRRLLVTHDEKVHLDVEAWSDLP